MAAAMVVLPLLLTAVDLSDDWRPRVLAEPTLSVRAALLALADERFADAPDEDRARTDRAFELHGVPPTLRVVRSRLLDDERHACHDRVDDGPLERLQTTLRLEADVERARADRRLARTLRAALEGARQRLGRASFDDLADDRTLSRRLRRLRSLEDRLGAVRAAQAHLRCEGLLDPHAQDGILDAHTVLALAAYQRVHTVISWGLIDPETRERLITDSRELDFRTLLRVLRERVVDATGLIEDGSALGQWGTVVGRTLDEPELRAVDRLPPLAGGAPDRVAEATDAAARALGWTSPAAARAWLAARSEAALHGLRVELDLPGPPRYHSSAMELRAEIDRGDVWLAPPRRGPGRRLFPRPVGRRPTLVLWAQDGEREIPLVRWNTTIGGWQWTRRSSGAVVLEYKGSDVGPRVWRDIVAAPVWLPPDETPDADLFRRDPQRGWVANRGVVGPGIWSAYGLVMMVHLLRDADGILHDHGVRTHGSANFHSILRGQSHGCHRLFNHLALRLASFLLAHRPYVVRGPEVVRFARTVRYRGHTDRLVVRDRGFVFELTPPVPVVVLPGTVHGQSPEPVAVQAD